MRQLILVLALTLPLCAQFSRTASRLYGGSSLPAHCSAGPPADIYALKTGSTTAAYYCSATDTWTMWQAAFGFTPVANTVTVNGHALSANVTVSASDVTTGTLPHAQLPALLSSDLPAQACVPTTYTLPYSDSIFTAAATTVSKTLLTLASTSQVLCDPAETTTALFAGTGVTAMTCSVGTATAGNGAVYVPAINVFATSPSYTASASMRPGDLAVPDSSLAVVVSCTANVNVGNGSTTVLTAGSIKITLGVKTLP